MSFFNCNLNKSSSDNDKYGLIAYYYSTDFTNASFTAPKNGTVQIWILMQATIKGINYSTASASLNGITASTSTYVSSFSSDYLMSCQKTGHVKVTEGETYSVNYSTTGNCKPYSLAFCVAYYQ